jgi:hypothetical protein
MFGSRPVPQDENHAEGRIQRARRVAGELRKDPGRALPLARGMLIDIWRSRGGGFYGLGYLVAFIFYEIEMIFGDLVEATSMSEFALGQILEVVFRLSFLSFVNAFQALLWPLTVLQLYEGLGIILLIGSYLAFEYLLRPWIEGLFPELKEHRELKARASELKAETKRRKRDRKPSRHGREESDNSGESSSHDPDR